MAHSIATATAGSGHKYCDGRTAQQNGWDTAPGTTHLGPHNTTARMGVTSYLKEKYGIRKPKRKPDKREQELVQAVTKEPQPLPELLPKLQPQPLPEPLPELQPQEPETKLIALNLNEPDATERHLKSQPRGEDPLGTTTLHNNITPDFESPAGLAYSKKPSPRNRFGLRPGYQWDGIDRSNGFERKWLEAHEV